MNYVLDTVSSASDFRVMSSFVRDWVRKSFALWTAPEDVHVGSDGIIELANCEFELKTWEELRLPLRPLRATLGSVRFSTFSREVVVEDALLLVAAPSAEACGGEPHVARAARLALVGLVERLLREEDDARAPGPAGVLAFREWSLRATRVHCRVECAGENGACHAAGACAEEIFISPATRCTSAAKMPSVLDLASRRRPRDPSWSEEPEWTRKVVFNGFRVYGRSDDAPLECLDADRRRARSLAAGFGDGYRAVSVRALDASGLPRTTGIGFTTRAYALVRCPFDEDPVGVARRRRRELRAPPPPPAASPPSPRPPGGARRSADFAAFRAKARDGAVAVDAAGAAAWPGAAAVVFAAPTAPGPALVVTVFHASQVLGADGELCRVEVCGTALRRALATARAERRDVVLTAPRSDGAGAVRLVVADVAPGAADGLAHRSAFSFDVPAMRCGVALSRRAGPRPPERSGAGGPAPPPRPAEPVSARTVEAPAKFNAPAVLAQPADAATDLYRDPQLSDLSVDVDVGDDARGAVDVAACYAFAEAVLDRVADAAAAERATSLRPLEPIPAPLRRLRRALKFESKFRGGFSTASPWDQFAALWSLRRTHARLASSLQRWPPRRADDAAPEKKAESPAAGRDYYLFRKASEGVDDDEPAHPRSRAVAPAHAYRDCAPSRDLVDDDADAFEVEGRSTRLLVDVECAAPVLVAAKLRRHERLRRADQDRRAYDDELEESDAAALATSRPRLALTVASLRVDGAASRNLAVAVEVRRGATRVLRRSSRPALAPLERCPENDREPAELPVLDTFDLEPGADGLTLRLSAVSSDAVLFGDVEVAAAEVALADLERGAVTAVPLRAPRGRKFFPDSFAAMAHMDFPAAAQAPSAAASTFEALEVAVVLAAGDGGFEAARRLKPDVVEAAELRGRSHAFRDRAHEPSAAAAARAPDPVPRLAARVRAPRSSLELVVDGAMRRFDVRDADADATSRFDGRPCDPNRPKRRLFDDIDKASLQLGRVSAADDRGRSASLDGARYDFDLGDAYDDHTVDAVLGSYRGHVDALFDLGELLVAPTPRRAALLAAYRRARAHALPPRRTAPDGAP